MSRYCKHGADPRNCYECPSQREALEPSDVTNCSPSSDEENDTQAELAAWEMLRDSREESAKLRALCDRAEDMLARAHVMLDGWQQAIDWHNDYRREFPENATMEAPNA